MDHARRSVPAVLDDIDRALRARPVHADLGLLSGTCGSALFYAYYYRLTGTPSHLDRVHEIVAAIVAELAQTRPAYSHCSGLAGVAWCLRHLIDHELVDADADFFDDIDAVLVPYLIESIRARRLDFLHDGLGAALYFLDRLPDPTVRGTLEEAFDLLVPHLAWRELSAHALSLAHGSPAIVMLLCGFASHGIGAARITPLVGDFLRWLRTTANPREHATVARYPAEVRADGTAIGSRASRLGWCNGDLAIAVTLSRLGQQLGCGEVAAEARGIFEHTLRRRTPENGAVHDASLCHGSMGISHVFRREYRRTGDDTYLGGADRWLERALHQSTWVDGAAGFKYRMQSGYCDRYDLLQGISGIGLGLIAALDRDTDPAWDRCLLLS